MLICFFGASCTGKTTVAMELEKRLNLKVYNGKEYVKLASNKQNAIEMFKKILESQEDILYVISDLDDVSLLPENTFKVLFTSNLATIKSRFSDRIKQPLSQPIEKMLERKSDLWSKQPYDLLVNSDETSAEEITTHILNAIGK